MGQIPADATHWDSGDWIDWHRHTGAAPENLCSDPSDDPLARLHALHARMLHCARTYFDLTGQHLPLYDAIGRSHAAIAFDRPSCVAAPTDLRDLGDSDAQIITIPPGTQDASVTVDVSAPFSCLIVVRITDDFTSEARLLPRAALPDQQTGPVTLRWSDLPDGW